MHVNQLGIPMGYCTNFPIDATIVSAYIGHEIFGPHGVMPRLPPLSLFRRGEIFASLL